MPFGDSLLVNILVPVLFGFIAGYFFPVLMLEGITGAILLLNIYTWWGGPLEGLIMLLQFTVSALSAFFLTAMWLTAFFSKVAKINIIRR